MKTSFRLTAAIVGLALFNVPAVVHGEDYTYTTNNGTITITGYTGPGGDVTIPSRIEDLPVTAIGFRAFHRCASLTTVAIPNSVTTLWDGAFCECISLVTFRIPNSVTNIGDEVVFGCTSLTAITVDEANAFYSSVDGVLFDKSQTRLIQYPLGRAASSYTIPHGVTEIGISSFQSCLGLTNISIAESVTNIEFNAFLGCSNLRDITVPDAVTTIRDNVFSDCTGLRHLQLGVGLTKLGLFVFANCSSLMTITVAPLNAAFSSLDGVLFDKSRTTLICFPAGRYGTYSIPNGVRTIGIGAFLSCVSPTP